MRDANTKTQSERNETTFAFIHKAIPVRTSLSGADAQVETAA